MPMIAEEKLLNKINALPPIQIGEVIDFVDFLAARESVVRRTERSERMSVFAAEYGGTEIDFDEALERTGVEHLLKIDEDAE